MDKDKRKRISIIIMKSIFTLMLIGIVSIPFINHNDMKDPGNPLSHQKLTEKQFTEPEEYYMTEVFTFEDVPAKEQYTMEDLLSNIKKFVDTPEGGTDWNVFGQTQQKQYSYTDEEGMQWSGVRPEFSDDLKKLDGSEILLQGYMFPLGQEEKQKMFLLGPFPVSCPYHYHVTPNLIIEVHAGKPVPFSYEAVNVKGTLELVPEDDEYNIFYRLQEAKLVP